MSEKLLRDVVKTAAEEMSVQTSPALLFVSLLACSIPAIVFAAESLPPMKPAANVETDRNDKPPLIVRNSDGTITVQKAPAPARTDDAAPKGLTIPPQVVVPVVRAPANDKKK